MTMNEYIRAHDIASFLLAINEKLIYTHTQIGLNEATKKGFEPFSSFAARTKARV